MARKKGREGRPRVRRDETEILAGLEADLISLKHLAAVYDGGHTAIAGTMATLVQNICGAGTKAAGENRGKLSMPTPASAIEKSNLAPQHRLIVAGASDKALKFVPVFAVGLQKPAFQKFQVWWHTEPVYIAGAAMPGTPLGLIPVNDTESVPYDEREKLTRVQFVGDLRNSIGAHPSTELTAILHDVLNPHSFGGAFSVMRPDGSELSTADGSLPVLITPAEALMRQIVQELLIAYGVVDASTWVASLSPEDAAALMS